MKIDYSDIASGPFPDYSSDKPNDVIGENQDIAQVVLRNWVTATGWGLPRAMIADMLDGELARLKGNDMPPRMTL